VDQTGASLTELEEENQRLASQIWNAIPDDCWDKVTERLCALIVEQMPSTVILKLTGELYDDEGAEKILLDFYTENPDKMELVLDGLRILGPTLMCDQLDALELFD